jgi:molybdopterin/thiamine biosynthesis adenylyltransferase
MSSKETIKLWNIIFKRYPDSEWGTFIRMGWRETSLGLVLTLQGIDEPVPGDIDENSWMTEIQAQYTKRILRICDTHPFGIGFVHSHPEGFFTEPSPSDYEMEDYYSKLLRGYTPDRPFISLIFSKNQNTFSGSGRVWWLGEWHEVIKFSIEHTPVTLYNFERPSLLTRDVLSRLKRLASAFSLEAAESLASATVAVVGVSGTGSPAVEMLSRSNVGNIIVVDPKIFEDSNHERNHASLFSDLGTKTPKVVISKRHIKSINRDCNVTAIQGNVQQEEVIDHLLWADIILGCTDLHSARIALTDLSTRYLLPVIDVGVKMEGENGQITGQVVQLNRLFPDDACVYCRGMVSSKIATQELMSEEQRIALREEADKATREGRQANAYWIEEPQLNTVGYLTTLGASFLTGFVIGYITGRFSMAKNRMELCIGPMGTTIVEKHHNPKGNCTCSTAQGCADQDPLAVLISAPSHWAEPTFF